MNPGLSFKGLTMRRDNEVLRKERAAIEQTISKLKTRLDYLAKTYEEPGDKVIESQIQPIIKNLESLEWFINEHRKYKGIK